jgi:hypothetical protein
MKILSIDIGITNFAMIQIELEEDYLERQEVIKHNEIIFCELINIIDVMNECSDKHCELRHDKIICDYVTHIFKKFKEQFDNSDVILIERQPPMGLVSIQELIMYKYRNKSILVSPNAMLNFFGLLNLDYSERKVHTEKIAEKFLNGFKHFVFNIRRHDMGDACVILYYYLSMRRKEHSKKIIQEENKIKYENIYLDLQRYIYTEEESN